jgi:hypothetical protein
MSILPACISYTMLQQKLRSQQNTTVMRMNMRPVINTKYVCTVPNPTLVDATFGENGQVNAFERHQFRGSIVNELTFHRECFQVYKWCLIPFI